MDKIKSLIKQIGRRCSGRLKKQCYLPLVIVTCLFIWITLRNEYYGITSLGIHRVLGNQPELLKYRYYVKKESNETQGTSSSDILIVAYMRTGSSFLGKAIGWRDDVFYWFEPLRKNRLWTYIRDHDLLCHNLNLDCKVLLKDDKLSSEYALTLMNDIFHCNLSSHGDKVTEINFSDALAPPNWNDYRTCEFLHKNSTKTQDACINHLEQSCKNATHRALKVLRIDLTSAAALLETNPRLKIIYIVRDPRGVINSHLTTGWYKASLGTNTSIDQDIRVLCSRMKSDITSGKRLMSLYPDRVKIIQYEDMGDTIFKTNRIYEFLNMEQSSKYNAFLHSVSGKPAEEMTTGGFHPFSFRQKLPWDVVNMANKHCSDIYTEFGVRKFTKESDFRNESIPVTIKKLPFALN